MSVPNVVGYSTPWGSAETSTNSAYNGMNLTPISQTSIFDRIFQNNKVEAENSAFMTAWEQAFAREEAEKERQWAERMSNTAYQRTAKDMRATGLNPYLLYNSSGSLSTAPSGATASASSKTTKLTNPIEVVGNLLLSAFKLGLSKK